MTLAARTPREIEDAAAAIRARGHQAQALMLDVTDIAAIGDLTRDVVAPV